MNNQSKWVDHIDNGQAVRGAFGERIPELRGLELVQLVLDPVGELAFTLELASLPDTVPSRWKDRGFDKLQLRMRFFIGSFVIRRDDAVGAWSVSVELQNKQLHVISDNGAFELTASFDHARIDFHPYRAIPHELPIRWFNPW